MVDISEYRKILGDYTSSDEKIKKRLEYLKAFCKNIISYELENYVKQVKEQKKSGISKPGRT
ncbi:MAG: hypothetical protein WAW92_03320 [Minisyncoccia bacterium]